MEFLPWPGLLNGGGKQNASPPPPPYHSTPQPSRLLARNPNLHSVSLLLDSQAGSHVLTHPYSQLQEKKTCSLTPFSPQQHWYQTAFAPPALHTGQSTKSDIRSAHMLTSDNRFCKAVPVYQLSRRQLLHLKNIMHQPHIQIIHSLIIFLSLF